MIFLFYIMFLTIVFCSCGNKPHEQDALLAQQSAERVRESWLDDRKPIEITVLTEQGDTLSSLPSIGVHARMREATESESAALCGVAFHPNRTNVYVSSTDNALCSDTTAVVSVCYPFHEGVKAEGAIDMKAPFGENLYGKEIHRKIDGGIKLTMQMRSAMAILRITTESDDLRDRLKTLRVSGDAICSEAVFMPYTGQWIHPKAGGIISTTDADCMMNNGKKHDIYLIPTETASTVTLFATVNNHDFAVKTTLPPMAAGTLVQLSLRKRHNQLSVGSSWIESSRACARIYNKCSVDTVKPGHYLQKDGNISATKDSASIAVVVETDGKHGKAVAIADADGRFCFSDKPVTSGRFFPTVDGKRHDGAVNPKKSDNVGDNERIIFKFDMPYGENTALGYGNGADLTQTLISKSNVESESLLRRSMLHEIAKHPCSYVPSLREMVQLYCSQPKGITPLQGEYITCTESGQQSCYMIDMDCGLICGTLSKQYGKMSLRPFYLF